MKAIAVDAERPGRPLSWVEVADPEVGESDVLVDVTATAVNRADLLQRAGHYPPPPGAPETLGLEASGVVAGAGAAATGWRPGDRVCALLAGGGYAERVAVDHRLLMPVPDGWDLARAAALPEAFLTAWVNLFAEAGLQAGERVLVHAGASGVGTAAIQLAREAGCRVLATAGTQAKRQRCRQLGAELALDSREGDFAAQVLSHLRDHPSPGAAGPAPDPADGVDVILDVAGASHLAGNLQALRGQGRLVLLSLLGGRQAAIDLGLVLGKRLRLIGSLLRSRPVAEKARIIEGFRRQFWHPLEAGRIAPVIDRLLPIRRAEEAHRVLDSNANIGKVILQVRSAP